jgi:hypothetical protein
MSGKIVGEVFRCAPADLTQAERLVLLCLADKIIEVSGDRVAKTTAAVIADECGLTNGTVRNALSSLARRALIVPLHKASRGHAQDYRLTPLSEHHRAAKRHPTMTLLVANPHPKASPHNDAKPALSVIRE